jgi:cation diffusion facilitator CzcD-associated flavoprotein CzcO
MSYLIIGAGPVGLGTARVLKENHIPYEQVEADAEVGGNWHHGVYRTAYVISWKHVMEYPEYPMPSSYPDFPSQSQLWRYFIDYSYRYDLRRSIRFRKKVISVLPAPGNDWRVVFGDGTDSVYRGVLICNGHHWSRRFPRYDGTFSGEYFHSKDYQGPEQLKDKKVLVIGAGNSGCDIVCEAARVGRAAHLSMRRSVWIFPKSFMGKPLGRIALPTLPRCVEDALIHALIRLTFGKHSQYNLPKPTYRFFERHPTVSEELPYYLRHGRVTVKPDVACFEGREVVFTDGSREQFDVVVAATGYNLEFPFLPKRLVRGTGSLLEVYGYCAYDDYKGLYFVGWPQVRGGVGSLISAYAQVVANFIAIEERFAIPIGSVLKSMGEKLPQSHLMGAGEMFRWMQKMTANRLKKAAARLEREESHVNEAIEHEGELDREMVVF